MAIEPAPWVADAATLRRSYASDPAGFVQRGFRASYWRRGGEVGPDWASDLLEFAAAGDDAVATWTKARPTPADFTVFDVQRWQGAPPRRMILLMLDCLLGDALFERDIPAEHLSQYRGTVNETVVLEVPPIRLEKTLYRAADLPETARLRGAAAEVTRWLQEHGRLLPA